MMSACTFFGHKDTPNDIEPLLRAALIVLIEKEQVYEYYVGNQGNFDRIVRRVLKKLKRIYPKINYAVVLPYLPITQIPTEDYSDTIFPLEKVPPRFAIDRRNHWMLDQSDFVVTYVWKSWGGAAKFKGIAKKRGLQVMELFETE